MCAGHCCFDRGSAWCWRTWGPHRVSGGTFSQLSGSHHPVQCRVSSQGFFSLSALPEVLPAPEEHRRSGLRHRITVSHFPGWETLRVVLLILLDTFQGHKSGFNVSPRTTHLIQLLEKEMATHSSVLVWRIPWTKDPNSLSWGQFSCSVVSDSLRPHGLQHSRLPSPSPAPRAYSNSYPLSWWCHPTISSSVDPVSSRLQSFPAPESFPVNQFFSSSGQSIGVSASASVLPMNIKNWCPLGSCLMSCRITKSWTWLNDWAYTQLYPSCSLGCIGVFLPISSFLWEFLYMYGFFDCGRSEPHVFYSTISLPLLVC